MSKSTPICKTDREGTRSWTLRGKLHRTDGPALEHADGSKGWYLHGKWHRTDGPAFESADGNKEWYVNGERHRTDGPAIESADGGRAWWAKGELHRADGPAIERADGAKSWWTHGKRHRTDGPALVNADGSAEWYVNGMYIFPPYYYLLDAAFARGLPIPEEMFPEMLEAVSEACASKDDELNQLNSILKKYWPTHGKKILTTLFMDTDPTIKHIAFLLLGRHARPENTQGDVRL